MKPEAMRTYPCQTLLTISKHNIHLGPVIQSTNTRQGNQGNQETKIQILK